ncbi:MAG: hypothetical protein V4495_25395 [Pseudomonadota bacterium]
MQLYSSQCRPQVHDVQLMEVNAFDVNREEVEAALTLILSSSIFCKAQRSCRLLKYLIESKLNGSVRDTVEYSIGIAVFDRDQRSYDTCDDPIVRVQVGRLRARLASYYAQGNNGAGLHITIPMGSYMPEICRKIQAPHPSSLHHRLMLMPLRSMECTAQSIAAGLDEEMTHGLFNAFGHQMIMHNSEARSHSPEIEVSHKLDGCVRIDDDALPMSARISLRMINCATGTISWSRRFDCPMPLGISQQEALADAICQDLLEYFAQGDAGIEKIQTLIREIALHSDRKT